VQGRGVLSGELGARVRPAALKAGARLAVVSPASVAKAELVRAGVERMQAMGYEAVTMPSALARGPLYYAGTVEERVRDLHAAFADETVDGIVCTRGGWGSAELLPHLDAGLVRANAKAFVGYSDHTSLHIWMAQEAGLATFHGPMVAADFAREGGVDEASWAHALGGNAGWRLGAGDGMRVLREGAAEGVLAGGCLSIVVESLGTAYAMRRASEQEPRILFLEDVGVKPYQWDRMLLHLRYAGMLEGVAGIVFGDMTKCVAAEEMALLEGALLHALRDFEGPIAMGLRSGHVGGANVTLPLGVRVRVSLSRAEGPRMEIVAGAVV